MISKASAVAGALALILALTPLRALSQSYKVEGKNTGTIIQGDNNTITTQKRGYVIKNPAASMGFNYTTLKTPAGKLVINNGTRIELVKVLNQGDLPHKQRAEIKVVDGLYAGKTGTVSMQVIGRE